MQRFRFAALACAAVFLAAMVPMLKSVNAQAASFSWSISDNHHEPAAIEQALSGTDIPPAYFQVGKMLYMVTTDGGNALYGNDIHVWGGTSIDTLSHLYDVTLAGSNFPTANGAHSWLTGGWVDPNTGIWYTTVHIEWNQAEFAGLPPTNGPNFRVFRRIGIARSYDHGQHWIYLGDAVTSDEPTDLSDYPGSTFDYGDGDQRLYIDDASGYAYLSYVTGWINKDTGARAEVVQEARCPLSQHLVPSCWEKYYQGAWTQPGIGGHGYDATVGYDDLSTIYVSTLHKYIAVMQNSTGTGDYLSWSTHLAQGWWEPLQQFQSYDGLSWYVWWLNPSTNSPYVTTDSARVYASCNEACGVILPQINADAKYMIVTFNT